MTVAVGRVAAILAAIVFSPAVAQQNPTTLPTTVLQSTVVVLDRDALFATSAFGRRVVREIEAASVALATENGTIQAELEAEERALTDLRDTMEREDFRDLAEEFDTRVVSIRQAQDAKSRAITQQRERALQTFLERANPVLVELARDIGALVVLDRRMVIASADQIDITHLARERIDAALNEAQMPTLPEVVPQPTDETDAESAPAPAPDR